jgi:hypothetical protein
MTHHATPTENPIRFCARPPERSRRHARENVAQSDVALALAHAIALSQPFGVNYGVGHF